MTIPSSLREYFLGPALTFHHQKTIMSTLYNQLNNPRFFRLVVIVTLISFFALVVRVIRLKRQTGLLPFVMGGVLIYSGFCLERSFRVGMLMDVSGNKWRDVIGVGGIRNSYVKEKILYLFRRPKDDNGKVGSGEMGEGKAVKDELSEGRVGDGARAANKTNTKMGTDNETGTNDNDEDDNHENEMEYSQNMKESTRIGSKMLNDGGLAMADKASGQRTDAIREGKDAREGKNVVSRQVVMKKVGKKSGNGVPANNSLSNSSDTPAQDTPINDTDRPKGTENGVLKDESTPREVSEALANKKTMYNDTLEQKSFIISLKQTMLRKENAVNRTKLLLASLKKTKKYVAEDLRLFEDNFENFLRASADVGDVLSNADISADLYKIDMQELKKDVGERIGIVDVLEGFLRITKGQKNISGDGSTGSIKFYLGNGDRLREGYGVNGRPSVFDIGLKDSAVNLVAGTGTANNVVNALDTVKDSAVNLLPGLGHKGTALGMPSSSTKVNALNLLPGPSTTDRRPNGGFFSALLGTGTGNSAIYEPLKAEDVKFAGLNNENFEAEKRTEHKSPFDLQETQNLVKIQVFMILQGLICLTIFIFMICNLLDIIPIFKLILLVILIGNIFIGIVSMVYAQALAKKCVLMDVPNCNKKNLFDVEEVVDILNEQQETDKHDALSFIERKFEENYEQLSVVVAQLQKYMEGSDSKVTHKIDVFKNLINKLLFIETHFSQPNRLYVPVYAMKRFLEDLQQQLVEISYTALFPIYRDFLECAIFFEREKGSVKNRVNNFLRLNTKRKEEKANEKCKKKIKKICKAKKDYEELAFALTSFGIVFVVLVCF